MANVSVKSELLHWAMERANTNEELLRARFPKLSQWLRGEAEPTLRQLEDFAQATSTPFGWLLLDEPPQEQIPIPYFRTTTDKPLRKGSAELLETIYIVQRRQEWVRDYLIHYEKQSPLPFVNSAQAGTSSVELADRMRKVLGLPEPWAREVTNIDAALITLRDTLESAGIFIVTNGIVGNNTSRPLNPGEFRGFVLVDDYAPFVFVNGADAKVAQMFTLAHEMAHIFFGRSAVFDLEGFEPASNETERACNEAAAEFLVPAGRLRSEWAAASKALNPFNHLAGIFKVSRIVVLRRARDLGLISAQQFRDFFRTNNLEQRPKSGSGGNFYASQQYRIGRRFGRTVVRAVREGVLPFTEAYSLTGISGKTFDNYATYVA